MKKRISVKLAALKNSSVFIKCLVYLFVNSLFLVLQAPVIAQPIITLSEAIISGLTNKQDIIGKNLDLSISNLQTKALYQKYLPQVSVEYQYLFNPILQTSILPIGLFNSAFPIDATKSVQFGTKWTQSASLSVILPVFDLSIKRKISEAKLQAHISVVSQEQIEYELAYIIAQTYFAIYLHEAKINSLKIDTNRTLLSYTILKSKYDEKRLLKSDLNKAKENHNNAVQLVVDEISLLVEDKVYLLFLMGTKEFSKWNFNIDTAFSKIKSIPNRDSHISIERLPDLQQLQLQSALTNLEVNTERTKSFPTINFKGFLGANQFANAFNPIAENTWFGLSYIGLDVKLPLLFGENPRNKIEQLKLKSYQYNNQQKDKTFQYENQLVKLNIIMKNLYAQLNTLQANIALSNESLDIFQFRVKEGQESALNLNLEEVNIQLLKSKYEINKKQLWVYWLDYLKTSGQLTNLWK